MVIFVFGYNAALAEQGILETNPSQRLWCSEGGYVSYCESYFIPV